MDGQDFAMPSPKRQRTTTPDETPTTQPSLPVDSTSPTAPKFTDVHQPRLEEVDHGSNDDQNQNAILDALMQHVEAEATPVASLTAVHTTQPDSLDAAADTQHSKPKQGEIPSEPASSRDEVNKIQKNGVADVDSIEEPVLHAQTAVPIATSESTHINEDHHVENTRIEHAAQQVDGIPPIESNASVHGTDGPEWEVDSSPYQSSTDSDSSDVSSDDSEDDDEDDDGDNDYAMLGPEEAARILMQGDGGSDDEGDKARSKGEGSNLRTANEQLEDVPPIPDITITDDMRIEELGSVEAVVENSVLVKGKVSGEYQVLESGSLLCSKDRTIVGVVAEPLGRVEQPLYVVRFRTGQEIQDRGLAEKGTVVFYVPQHSSFVFTQPLKAFKGSDASNFHDEEVGDEEIEFSDDEAEAEHKKQLKLKRQGRLGDNARGRGSTRGGKGGQRGGYKPSPLSTDANGSAYGNGSLEMNYDDVDEEESYTPLTRPANFHEMMGPNNTIDTNPNSSHMPPPPFSDRGRGRGRGHHNRGRDHDRSNRGARGNFRGNNNRGGSHQHQPQNQSQSQYPSGFANQFPQLQFPYPQPPTAPSLTPQNPPYPFSTTTSPISPLPKQQFNFNAGSYQAPQPYNPTYQGQQQPTWNPQIPTGFAPQMNPTNAMQFSQQFAQYQQQNQQQNQQQGGSGWQVNQAAAAEVQRQLEQMMRNQNGNTGGGNNSGTK